MQELEITRTKAPTFAEIITAEKAPQLASYLAFQMSNGGVECGNIDGIGAPEVVADLADDLERWLQRETSGDPRTLQGLISPLADRIAERFGRADAQRGEVLEESFTHLCNYYLDDEDARESIHQSVQLAVMEDARLIQEVKRGKFNSEMVRREISYRIARRARQIPLRKLEEAIA